jgi:hypothetical protein
VFILYSCRLRICICMYISYQLASSGALDEDGDSSERDPRVVGDGAAELCGGGGGRGIAGITYVIVGGDGLDGDSDRSPIRDHSLGIDPARWGIYKM